MKSLGSFTLILHTPRNLTVPTYFTLKHPIRSFNTHGI